MRSGCVSLVIIHLRLQAAAMFTQFAHAGIQVSGQGTHKIVVPAVQRNIIIP